MAAIRADCSRPSSCEPLFQLQALLREILHPKGARDPAQGVNQSGGGHTVTGLQMVAEQDHVLVMLVGEVAQQGKVFVLIALQCCQPLLQILVSGEAMQVGEGSVGTIFKLCPCGAGLIVIAFGWGAHLFSGARKAGLACSGAGPHRYCAWLAPLIFRHAFHWNDHRKTPTPSETGGVSRSGVEPRVLQAARQFQALRLGCPILLGDRTKVKEIAADLNISLEGIRVINPAESEELDNFARRFYSCAAKKGLKKPRRATRCAKRTISPP